MFASCAGIAKGGALRNRREGRWTVRPRRYSVALSDLEGISRTKFETICALMQGSGRDFLTP